MVRRRKDVTEAELAVLQVLWERGRSTIREITDLLYPAGGASPYATVQKLLERLEGKACVRRRRASAAHVFESTIDRQELIGRRLEEITDGLCGGSLAPVISHLVERSKLTPAERSSLRRLVAGLDADSGDAPKSKGRRS